jgi:hypothetical protein
MRRDGREEDIQNFGNDRSHKRRDRDSDEIVA